MTSQPPIDNLVIRQPEPPEFPAIEALVRQAKIRGELTNFTDTEIDRLIEWISDEPQKVSIALAGDTLVGVLPGTWGFALVAPEWRRRGIGTRLVQHALALDPDLELGPDNNDPTTREFLASVNFSLDHLMNRMKRPADLPPGEVIIPEGFFLRTYEHSDFDTYFALWNRAFLDHPTPLQTSEARMRAVHSRDSFDPTRIALIARATDPADLVGFITTRALVEEDGETIGPIGAIGTDGSVRRLGLGRALLRWGIQRLKQDGAGPITLEVVTINERALPLYESEGFVPHQTWEFWKYKG